MGVLAQEVAVMVAPRRLIFSALLIVTLVGGVLAQRSADATWPGASVPGEALTAVAVSGSEIDLTWSPTVSGSARVVLRRNDQLLTILAAGTTQYSDRTVQPAMLYRYTLEPAAGTAPGSSLPTVLIRTPTLPDTPDRRPPSPPEGVSAVGGAGWVLLDWAAATDDSEVTAYRVRRNGQVLATVNGGTLRFVDRALAANAVYTYTLTAFDVVGHESAPTDPVRAQVQPGPAGAPPADPPSGAGPAAPLTYAGALRRYPYLTDVVGPYATVNWATDRSAPTGTITWGQVGGESCTAHTTAGTRTALTVNGVAEYQWTVPLTLTTGTQYCYRVYLGNTDLLGSDPAPRFWTQVPAGSSQPFTFAVLGDWGAVDSSGNNGDQANLLRQLATSGARFALTVGDNAYPSGSQNNYGDLAQTGTNLSGVFGPPFWKGVGARLPLFPSIGNHGFSRSDTYHPHLLNWPQSRAVATSGGRYTLDTYCCLNGTTSAVYPSTWYAFDAGLARFYVLEATWDEGNEGTASVYADDYAYHWTADSAEYQWLAQDLAGHPSALKFAFLHYPLYSDNTTEPADAFLRGPQSLEGLLSSYGVDIAFSGHAHIYQRNTKPNAGSLITYLTGGGGAKLEPIGQRGCSAEDAFGIGWSYTANGGLGGGSACGSAPLPAAASQVFHFLRVSVNGTQVTVAPTDEQGRTFDVQTYNFGSSVATATRTPVSTRTPVPTVTQTPSRTPLPSRTVTPPAPATSTATAPVATATPPATPTNLLAGTSTPSRTPSPTAGASRTPPPATPAVVFSDGFETGDLAAWSSSGGLSVQQTLVHGGSYAAQANTTTGTTYAKKTLPAAYGEGYARLYFNLVSASSQVNLVRYRTAGDASLGYLFISAAGQLGLRNDVAGTTLGSTITISGGWHALEFHALINGAASRTDVWLDGNLVSDLSSSTNLGSSPIGRLQVGDVQSGRTYNVVFDDVVFDTRRTGP